MSKARKIIMAVLAVVLVVSATLLVLSYREQKQMESEVAGLEELMNAAMEAAKEAEREPAESPVSTADPSPAPTDATGDAPPAETEAPAETEPEMLSWLVPLYELNSDLCGWLSIEDSVIQYPVMYTPEDPDYYLRRSFYKKDQTAGTLYADADCDPFTPSDNIIIYGHNMRSETMFGTLDLYEDYEYWQEHMYVDFDTLYERREYVIFAVFRGRILNAGEAGFRYYTFMDADSEEEFDDFIKNVTALSEFDTGLTAEYGDELLTLSTCHKFSSDSRLVLVAKRVA